MKREDIQSKIPGITKEQLDWLMLSILRVLLPNFDFKPFSAFGFSAFLSSAGLSCRLAEYHNRYLPLPLLKSLLL